jgi:predicted ATPase
MFNIARGRLDRGEENSDHLFKIARELDDPEILLQAHHSAWPIRWVRGQFAEADNHISAGLALYDEERHAHHRSLYLGHDPAVCALSFGATVQWALGYPAQADRLAGESIALARKLRHPPSLVIALWIYCGSLVLSGDFAAVKVTVSELIRLSDEHGLPQGRANALLLLGWALARSGEVAEGIARLEEGLGIFSRIGFKQSLSASLCLLAESLLAAGRYADGLEQVTRGLDAAAEMGEYFYLVRLHQVRAGLLLHAQGQSSEAAEASLQQALAVAQQQGKGVELYAATSLARLWLDRGRRDAARELLGPIYGWFTEGFDTPDLVNAKALLNALN